jgi:hypothetical protein
MNEEKSTYTVRELFELVRRGMVWRGKSIENKIDKLTTGKMWLAENDICQGIIAVKSAAMHDTYLKWCQERGITGKAVLSMVALGRLLQETFKSTRYDNSTHYFINKEMHEDSQAQAERQKLYASKKKTKKPQKETD